MGPGERSFTVRFHRPADEVFDYLSDPRTRPEWQSSLRRVDLLTDPATGVGARWRDVTLAGMRPEMLVVTHEPGQAWAEEGRWRGLTAYLALTFVPQGGESDVEVLVSLTGSGWWRLPALVTGWLGPAALRADLRRADRLLTRRAG